jgi:hypothetical protein
MGLCPVCGNWACDHTAQQRGQTNEEMMKPMSKEEMKAFNKGDQVLKLAAAKKHAHDRV